MAYKSISNVLLLEGLDARKGPQNVADGGEWGLGCIQGQDARGRLRGAALGKWLC